MVKRKATARTQLPTGPLNFLRPRETSRVKKARGKKPLVTRLRVVLPAASAFILLGLCIWPVLHRDKILSKALKQVPDIMIENLNYAGTDSKNQPYSISAGKAIKPAGTTDLYDLERPQAEITLDNGSWVSGKSLFGRYDKENNHLWLGGDVQIFHDKGFQFTTDELQADLNERMAWGEKPVLIQGGFGEIRGLGFRLLDSGNVMVIKGPAKAYLNLHGSQASDKPATKP
jgi:lipopolysaccharide export system protein LptC